MNQHWRLHALAIGPPRTGTSWLHNCLCHRPELTLPARKETYFWNRYFHRGQSWYRDQFQNGGLPVEVCPEYFADRRVRERIEARCADLRIIVTARDPVERTWSHYRHYRATGRVNGGFWDAVEEYPEILEDSRYSVHLPKWEAMRAVSRLEIISLADIAEHPGSVLDSVAGALGLEPWRFFPDTAHEVKNPGRTSRSRWVARLASGSGWVLRHAGLEDAVTILRDSAIGRVIRNLAWSEQDTTESAIQPALRASLERELRPERVFLENREIAL